MKLSKSEFKILLDRMNNLDKISNEKYIINIKNNGYSGDSTIDRIINSYSSNYIYRIMNKINNKFIGGTWRFSRQQGPLGSVGNNDTSDQVDNNDTSDQVDNKDPLGSVGNKDPHGSVVFPFDFSRKSSFSSNDDPDTNPPTNTNPPTYSTNEFPPTYSTNEFQNKTLLTTIFDNIKSAIVILNADIQLLEQQFKDHCDICNKQLPLNSKQLLSETEQNVGGGLFVPKIIDI